MVVNYIKDVNRWRLSTPPAWVQQQLWDYDPLLVMLPSRQTACYHLARRSRVTLSPDLLLHAAPDTKMLAQYGLVPVAKVIRAGLSWNIDTILDQVRHRDIWANGGAETVADRLDAEDEAGRQAVTDSIRTDMDYRSRDAWRSYQARTGQRVQQSGSAPLSNSPSGSTA